MKKFVLAVSIAAVLSVISFGAVMAQEVTPLYPGGNGGNGGPGNGDGIPVNQSYDIGADGKMTDYMHAAYADALGITVEELDTRINAGETVFAIAESLGLDFYAIQAEARLTALEFALADGAITQEAFNFVQDPGQGQANPEAGNGTGNASGQPRIRGKSGSQNCVTAAP